MANVLVRLNVQQYNKWRPIFDEFAALRKTHGSRGGRLFWTSDKPNQVSILFDWDSLEKARGFFQLDEVRAGMQRAGVQGPPDLIFVESGEQIAA
jgi:hypothetical protein